MGMTANLVRVSKEKLAEMQADPSLVGALVMDVIQGRVDAASRLDLYKSWNALDVLLNDGECGAEADAVMGGTAIGEDLGFGPARMLDDHEVTKVSDALANITRSDFEKRFDVEKMQDIYAFHAEDAEDEWPVLSELFDEMKTFYATAAEQSCGMILYLV